MPVLKYYNGSAWVPVSGEQDEVKVATTAPTVASGLPELWVDTSSPNPAVLTAPPIARFATNASASIGATWAPIPTPAVVINTDGMTLGTNGWTIQHTGYYIVIGTWVMRNTATGWCYGRIDINGTSPIAGRASTYNVNGDAEFGLSHIARLNAGDQIRLMGFSTVGSTYLTGITTEQGCFLELAWIDTALFMTPPITPPSWMPLTLQNGWVPFNASTEAVPGLWKDALGVVHIQGLIKDGTVGTDIAQIPVGYRPLRTKRFPVVCASGTVIFGAVQATGSALNHIVGGTGWVDLSTIQYPAEA
jgi:hypothetical protein